MHSDALDSLDHATSLTVPASDRRQESPLRGGCNLNPARALAGNSRLRHGLRLAAFPKTFQPRRE
jgi:hypothetical protein